MNHRAIIFLHVPKNAGTTFRAVLAQRFMPHRIGYLYNRIMKGDSEIRNIVHGKQLIAGHYGWGMHRYTHADCRYITFLRDPVKRVISLYNHIIGDKGHPIWRKFKGSSLRDFVTQYDGAQNAQIQYLSGAYGIRMTADKPVHPDSNRIMSESNVFELALENILKDNVWVGITDSFDLSMKLIEREFGASNSVYVDRNVRCKSGSEELDSELVGLIQTYNSFDCQLVDAARRKLVSMSDRLGLALDQQGERMGNTSPNNRASEFHGKLLLRYGLAVDRVNILLDRFEV